ncbi:rab-GTPase-TBC domain-containing protein [Xylogone sp. PMI_703]|nr:rab-GTPase-TBC domain-containing protein [Xylogone sp. PMI_703]
MGKAEAEDMWAAGASPGSDTHAPPGYSTVISRRSWKALSFRYHEFGMRTLEDLRARWQLTLRQASTLDGLKKAVKSDGDDNPCKLGFRSVAWKIFLLFQNTDITGWSRSLSDSRSAYTSLRQHLLRYIDNPDELGSDFDPLSDDQNSSWNTLRRDEEMRAEIFQDIERCMQEEPFFRRQNIQRMMLDILFVFCKINQDVGYRQGMHELLAPIIWVVEQDAIKSTDDCLAGNNTEYSNDPLLKDILDSAYVEHDAFTLLSLVMRSAKSFYELGEPDPRPGMSSTNTSGGTSPIVERSKKIHEFYLAKVDPELARHLTDIEVLPQIFLIRWIRLLFGREFPFDDLLGLWDTLFSEDPELNLVDLVCVSMLVRIRWQLLEANYSLALMLLLKYPSPSPPHAPKTFVDDAIYLRDNLSPLGGAGLNNKYSERQITLSQPTTSPPVAEERVLSPIQRLSISRSPLSARFLQQQGGVEALFQGAAKGVFERGERLGINQAVRDAVGEVRKNVQLQVSKAHSTSKRHTNHQRYQSDASIRTSLPSLQNRNRHLAKMLDNAMVDLRAASVSTDEEKEVYLKAMDLAISRVDFVRVYLEDDSIPLPLDTEEPATPNPDIVTGVASPSSAQEDLHVPGLQTATQPLQESQAESLTTPIEKENAEDSKDSVDSRLISPDKPETKSSNDDSTQSSRQPHLARQPKAPVPTRASIAQSSFAWMLEPDDSSNSRVGSSTSNPPATSSRPAKRSNVRREKTAFLFGEIEEDPNKNGARHPSLVDTDEVFDLGTIRDSRLERKMMQEER